jgi:DNA mismatch endonuclease, patch repair protein
MTDIVSPETRSRMMSGIKGRDTQPEIQIRKILSVVGYRYRIGNKKLPGKPDITLAKYKAVIFVEGCFWHGHEDCALFRIPKSRVEFWKKKIAGNILRDRKNRRLLSKDGWRICTVWECALKGKDKLDTEKVERSIIEWILNGKKTKNIRGRKLSKR